MGLPPSVLQIVHGLGEEAGAALVESPAVDVVSFTGSCEVGRAIAARAGRRLAKVCLELGGKNAFVVCDDADLESAAQWAALSAFSNAGQRCAAGSRVVVMDAVYERFRSLLLERTRALRVGCSDADDLGPVINAEQLRGMLEAVDAARKAGASVLVGGDRLRGAGYDGGSFMAPTLIEGAKPGDAISRQELFGPITCLYRVGSFEEAIAYLGQRRRGRDGTPAGRGVTLIELMVGLALIGALMGIAMSMDANLGRQGVFTATVGRVLSSLNRVRNSSMTHPAALQVNAGDPEKGEENSVRGIEFVPLFQSQCEPPGPGESEMAGALDRNGSLPPGASFRDGVIGRALFLDGGGAVDCGNHPAYDATEGVSVDVWIFPSASAPGTVVRRVHR